MCIKNCVASIYKEWITKKNISYLLQNLKSFLHLEKQNEACFWNFCSHVDDFPQFYW